MTLYPEITPAKPWLAPLAGYSDLPFRLLCRELGADVACTEMISAKGLVYKSAGTLELAHTTPDDQPLVVQLFGSDPEFLRRATALLLEDGHGLFDLNCGCPVRKVARAGGGAALLQHEDLILDLVRAMTAEAGPGRVGVKIRLGWERNTPVYLGLGPRLQEAGAAWITLHPRYGRQGFSGRAHWESLARLVQAVDIPVVASGDLFTAEDAMCCLQETGAAAVMFARGALSDPAVFMRFKALRSSDAPAKIPSLGTIVNRMHELCHAHGNPERMLLRMRTLVPRMIKGLPGAKNLRRDLTSCRSWENLHRLMESIETLTESTSD